MSELTNTAGSGQIDVGHVIDGQESESASTTTFDSVNPWSQSAWARVALGGPADAERALTSARRAFDDGPWPRMSQSERSAILHSLANLIDEHADELAAADTADMGKPIADSRGNDVIRSAANFRFFADHARLITPESLPSDTGHHVYTRYEPSGVAVAISPWNFPLMLATWKVAPALAWGNTVVLKPAEQSPVSATILARLALEAGLPPGVLNVVHGTGPTSVGEALTSSPMTDLITFTGASATGRAIASNASANLTKTSLELGGKGANIVFADADLDNAVAWSARAIFSNAGQVCVAGSRIYVQREIAEEFVRRLVEAANALTFGDPSSPTTELGPLASEEHFVKVRGYLQKARSEGVTFRSGGEIDDRWAVRPTVLTDVNPTSPLVREEIFGPVVVVETFDGEGDAITAANDTPFGLNAMVFTSDLSRAHRVAARLKAGSVWVNCFFIRDLRAPFGGVGDSGIGREGGAYSREFCTEPKAVVMQIDH